MFATKDGAPLAAVKVKVDTYVLETDVHFPTDLNLLWDAGRKCVDLIEKYRGQFGYQLPGWRKAKEWRRQLKRCERSTSHIVCFGITVTISSCRALKTNGQHASKDTI